MSSAAPLPAPLDPPPALPRRGGTRSARRRPSPYAPPEKLFAGLAQQITDLGGKYIPVLEGSFGRVASAANLAARGVGESLSTGARVADVTTMTGNFASAWESVLGAARPLVSVLLDVGTVASGFLPGLTSGAGDAAQPTPCSAS